MKNLPKDNLIAFLSIFILPILWNILPSSIAPYLVILWICSFIWLWIALGEVITKYAIRDIRNKWEDR